MMTIADVQRQNRETAQKRKRKAIRIASSFAIGLHVIGIIAGAIYFVRKTVLEMNDDKVESVVLEASKPEAKRRLPLVQHENRNNRSFLRSGHPKDKLSRRVLKSQWATHVSRCQRATFPHVP